LAGIFIFRLSKSKFFTRIALDDTKFSISHLSGILRKSEQKNSIYGNRAKNQQNQLISSHTNLVNHRPACYFFYMRVNPRIRYGKIAAFLTFRNRLIMSLPTQHYWKRLALASAIACCCLLVGCGDKDDANKEAERDLAMKDAEGKATGGACRQAGRALEDCFNLNQTALRSAVFAGWRDMNDYMRENKMADVKPTVEPPKSADASGLTEASGTMEKEKESSK
jgi:hypothetical protein